jgi:hypothetical protein
MSLQRRLNDELRPHLMREVDRADGGLDLYVGRAALIDVVTIVITLASRVLPICFR